MKNGLTLFLFFLLSVLYSQAQFINFGQDRSSLRWKQIKTNDFQIIYPDFFEENAQKAANIYTRLYRHANTLQLRPKKISMILHADGGVSNGNVGLVPRKSELYTTPPQDPTDSWLEHLCVHEFRHVIQFDKVNQGMTKGLSYIFGELFPIAIVGLYVPMWFMEGDAVCFESSVGHIGRGRSPEFLNEMKAQVVEKGIYNFPKAILGSYKDFVPNRYTMGYFMTANTRINYGPYIWAKALERSGRRPYSLVPFNSSLKQSMKGRRDSLWQNASFRALFPDPDSVYQANTFHNAKRTLYRDNFSQLQQIWKAEARQQNNLFDTIPTRDKFYMNYYYPTPTADGQVIAYQKGLRQAGAFVSLNGQSTQIITRTGIPDDYKFALNHNHLLWSEYKPHIRWTQGGRAGLSSYDLARRKYRHIRSPHNLFSPFAAGNNWGYVEVTRENKASIVITDSLFRHEIARFPAQNDELFIHPAYHNGQIVTVVQSPAGIRLEKIDIQTGVRRKITEDIFYETDNPALSDSLLIYRASYNGNNAFYRMTPQGPANILNGKFGVRFPHLEADSNRLFFSFYTSDGYKAGCISLDKLQEKPVEYNTFPIADSMKKQENWQLSLQADSVFPTRKYRKFTHLINIHSWAPLDIDINDIDVDFGAVIYSQNKLSTLYFTAGYVLKSGYEHGAWIFNGTYSGWWPMIDFKLESGRYDYYSLDQGINLQTKKTEYLYIYNKARQSSAEATLRLPLNLSVKQYNRYLQPYFRYTIAGLHRQRPDKVYSYRIVNDTARLSPANKGNYRISQSSRHYQLLEYGITFNNQTRMTDQEINPRWGQMLSVGYTHSPWGNIDLGHQWWTDGRLYFPGIFFAQSLSVYGGFQHISGEKRSYSNKILYPRGITLRGYEISSLRCSYRLPLAFPDQHLGPLLYFKSIDAAIFYDMGTSRDKSGTRRFSSYGIELTTDTHFFRLTYPVHLGFRTGYEDQTKRMFADVIFSIGLSI